LRSTQASAICASVWPRRPAITFSALMLVTLLSLMKAGRSDLPCEARLPSGMPPRYLSVSLPCASGENTIEPMPSPSSVSSRPSSSTQRLSIE